MLTISFTEIVKNIVEFLNGIYETQIPGAEFQWLIFLKYLWNIFKDWVIYILTLQWIFDFIKYPIYTLSGFESILYNSFDFVSFSKENIFSFFNGFLNCFFLYLPFSPVQLIWLRRVIIDGKWAGLAASVGLICGNLSFLAFCLFGFREFINIWFGFIEPLSYFFGIWLIFVVIFEITHRPIQILQKSQKKQLLKIAIANFLLVWGDQPGLYQFFGNLSLSDGVTPLDFSNTTIIYFLGIVLGSICWVFLISFAFLHFGYNFPRITRYRYTYSYWIRGFNNFCLIGCITLTLTSLPFYGFDYLFANPLGFSSQDSIWETIQFLPKLRASTPDTIKGRLGEKSSYGSIDTDLSIFDRGRYGGGPPVEFHIESLNYKEEYAWRSRLDRVSSRNLPKNGGLLNKYLNEQLGPLEEALRKQRQEKKKVNQIQRFQKLQKKKNLNFYIEDEPNLYKFTTNLIESNESLIERFVEDYTAEANKEDYQVPDLVDERMIHFSAFSEIVKYGFDLFSIFEITEPDPIDEELITEMKQKYSENLIYKFFINFDISNFMKRQPYKLSAKDEIELFKKRLALGEYYNTLRSYSQLPSVFEVLFCGPKSYSNRIYNQQFQGTLKIVEHLFSISLEKEKNIPTLPEIEKKEQSYFFKDPSILKFDQPLYKKDLKNPLIHEQLMEYLPPLLKEVNSVPFLQEEKPLPFFVGWNNENRKFIVTNRFLTRQKTLVNITLPKPKKLFVTKKKKSKNNVNFTFTTWPVSEDAFRKNSFLNRLYSTRDDIDFEALEGEDLFKYAEPLMEEEIVIYEKLPSIAQRVDLKNLEKLNTPLIPTRGGFVWPGNSPLKFQIKEKVLIPLWNKIEKFRLF